MCVCVFNLGGQGPTQMVFVQLEIVDHIKKSKYFLWDRASEGIVVEEEA